MRRTAIATAALLLATTAACSSATDNKANESSPTPTPSTASPTYDEYDCRALLERNYDADNVYDASSDPECADLTRDEYTDVVKQVLTGRKDEILQDAGQHIVWDQAWDETDTEQQQIVCDRLLQDGAETVGQEMAEESGDDVDEQIEMAEYLLDEKC
ncbi:hypothetical protein [Streptomyces sp. enrichment culture]|uniref:hypothetical protein n=1 Tax=Streptomyces sp. enrichment culture TaxID=1795815 RepID=UPI003F54EC2F